MMTDFIIIGAGIAGLSAATTLRSLRSDAEILVLNGEQRPPYKRTSLSKRLADDPTNVDELQASRWYETHEIELRNATTVTGIDTAGKTVHLADGQSLAYGALLIATGAAPTPPAPAATLTTRGFREMADAVSLRADWLEAGEARIIGGGILGVELALQARRLGLPTTLHVRQRLLNSELPEALSERLAGVLAGLGIVLQPVPGDLAALGADPRSWLTATGSAPRLDLALRAGLACGKGILVDQDFRTSDPAIHAAGDCAELPGGCICHLWHDAENQGQAAARAMAGWPAGYQARPWRTKLAAGDDFYFFMNPGKGPELQRVELPPVMAGAGPLIQYWWGDPDKVNGVALAGDAARFKQYEQAVLEGWSLDRIHQELG